MDLKQDDAKVRGGVTGVRGTDGDMAWRGYPQSLFGNWTEEQVKRCRMFEVMNGEGEGGCVVYPVDVRRGRVFRVESHRIVGEDRGGSGDEHHNIGDENAQEAFWMRLNGPVSRGLGLCHTLASGVERHGVDEAHLKRDTGVRLHALFVECMSEPVLQMLGTR